MAVVLLKKRGAKPKYKDGKAVSNKAHLSYVKKLPIPPAYRDIEVHLDPKEKILYTAMDQGGKKQYFYKDFWNNKQSKAKFMRMIEFGKAVPQIKKDIYKISTKKGNVWDTERIVALQLSVIMLCNFRVGNLKPDGSTKSTGISTLKNSHIFFKQGLTIRFIGKSGIENICDIKDRQIIKNIKELSKINKKGFLFINDKGKRVDSKDINAFLKRYGNFSSKDFRTWVANTSFIKNVGTNSIDKDDKTIVKNAIKSSAEKLHHTPAICKKRYLLPELVESNLRELKKDYKNKGEDKTFILFLQNKV
jgi:DNA topoisomerase-1